MKNPNLNFPSQPCSAAAKQAGIDALKAGASMVEANKIIAAFDAAKSPPVDAGVKTGAPTVAPESKRQEQPEANEGDEANEILAALFGPCAQDSATPPSKSAIANDNAADAEAERILAAAFGEATGEKS